MTGGFTELELAVLRAILAEAHELSGDLERQLAAATVAKRENTGHGFFTSITVAIDASRVTGPSHLGQVTHAKVKGLEYGLGFVLFLKDGLIHLLEGYAIGPEDTTSFNLAKLEFSVTDNPCN